MTAAGIAKAIEEAYKNAEKMGPIQYSWRNGVEQATQFFQGKWGDRIVQFYYNYTSNTAEVAWP